MPATVGIQLIEFLDSRIRGNDILRSFFTIAVLGFHRMLNG